MKSILAALDFSDTTNAVIEAASVQAQAFGARLDIIHVAAPDPDFIGYEVGPRHERDFRASVLHREHERLNHIVDVLKRRGIDASAHLIAGVTVDVLKREIESRGASLLVLGSHSHGVIFNIVAGGVAQSMLKAAIIPVLIVPKAVT